MRAPFRSLPGAVVIGLTLLVGVALLVRGPGLGNEAQIVAARTSLEAGQLDAAQAEAHAALRRDPTSVDALVVLAEAAVAREDLAAARALHGEAAGRSQRAVTSHAWLASHLGGQGDVAGALHHVDVLLRGHFDLRESLYPALAQLLDSQAGIEALAGRLGAAPAWRLGFMRHLGRDEDASSESLLALYSALEHTPNPPTLEERQPLLQRLVGEERYRQAWLMFVATLDGRGLAELGNVFNGSFELDSSGLPFDWQFGRVAGAVIEQVQAVDDQGERGRRLRIDFLNRRVPFNHVSQLLLLDPGEYRLEGRVRLESLSNPRGLQWVVQCAPAPRTELLRSERFNGTRAWSRFGDEFSVPAEGCEAQWLRLQIPARIDAERQVSGRAWFDDMTVQRSKGEQ